MFIEQYNYELYLLAPVEVRKAANFLSRKNYFSNRPENAVYFHYGEYYNDLFLSESDLTIFEYNSYLLSEYKKLFPESEADVISSFSTVTENKETYAIQIYGIDLPLNKIQVRGGKDVIDQVIVHFGIFLGTPLVLYIANGYLSYFHTRSSTIIKAKKFHRLWIENDHLEIVFEYNNVYSAYLDLNFKVISVIRIGDVNFDPWVMRCPRTELKEFKTPSDYVMNS